MPFTDVAELAAEVGTGLVYTHGWQSWSSTTAYRLDQQPFRPPSHRSLVMHNREGQPEDPAVYQGEGLLAVQPAAGAAVQVFSTTDVTAAATRIRARLRDGRLVVSADGPVAQTVDDGPGGIDGALGRWAAHIARTVGVGRLRPAPTMWSSWYQYFTEVTQDDVLENLAVMTERELPVDVVQLDDGYQTCLGDWLSLSDRFESLPGMVDPIAATGRRAGIWVAPFLVGAESETAREHPDWLVPQAWAGHNWGQDLHVLDVTHPEAADYLTRVFTTMRGWGFDLFKIDFIYAGALPGPRHDDVEPLVAYRRGVQLVRDAIGPDAYLLGCGAPILPSIGLVDAMRVSPDCAPYWDAPDGDISAPGNAGATLVGRGRAFTQGRFWVNDPDCLLARPGIERREQWAQHVRRYGGLRASSDRLNDLDEWGWATTRELVRPVGTTPFDPDPW